MLLSQTWSASRLLEAADLVRSVLAVDGAVALMVVVQALLAVVAGELSPRTGECEDLTVQLVVPVRTVGAAVARQVDRDTLAGRAAELTDLAVCRHLTGQPVALQYLSERTSANLQQATSTAHNRMENLY